MTGNHRYLDEPAGGGSYTITAVVSDEDGKSSTATTSVSVAEAPISNVWLNASTDTSHASVSISGGFNDPADDADVHTVTITWGDGSSSVAAVDESSQTFDASHAYPNVPPGGMTFTITALVSDEDGTSDSASADVQLLGPCTLDKALEQITITAPQPQAYESSASRRSLSSSRSSTSGMEFVELQASGSATADTDYYIGGDDWRSSPTNPSQGFVVFGSGVSSITLDIVPINDQQAGEWQSNRAAFVVRRPNAVCSQRPAAARRHDRERQSSERRHPGQPEHGRCRQRRRPET